MWRWKSLLLAMCLALLLPAALAQSDQSAAELAAQSFLRRLDNGDLTSLYRDEMAPRAKSLSPESQFLQGVGMARIQTGGPALIRKLVGSQSLDQIQGIPEKGTFYYIRHHTRYPTGPAFQDIYLEKVGGSWKVIGFWNFPAPPI